MESDLVGVTDVRCYAKNEWVERCSRTVASKETQRKTCFESAGGEDPEKYKRSAIKKELSSTQ
jgi:hypothetical protein